MKVINEKLLKAYRQPGRCEWCKLYLPRREANHLIHRGMGGGSRIDLPANLTGLCPHFVANDCHRKYGNDPRCYDRFFDIVAYRDGWESGEAVKDYLQMILRLPKNSPIPAPPVIPF